MTRRHWRAVSMPISVSWRTHDGRAMSDVNHTRFLADYQDLKSRGERMTLITLVAAAGSTYRKAGARLLVTESGQMTGLVSGGCLEGGLLLEAKKVFASGQSRNIEIDMRAEEEGTWGLALGCNGLVKLHLQLLDSRSDANLLDCIASCYHDRVEGLAISRLEDGDSGCEWLFELGEQRAGTLQITGSQRAELVAAAPAAANLVEIETNGRLERYFVEQIRPAFSLLVLGAGPDAVPVCELARTLGWYTQLVDHRAAFIRKAVRCGADEVIRAAPTELAGLIDLDKVQAVVVMSHDVKVDAGYLAELLPGAVPYVGLLGPAYRGEELMDRCDTRMVQHRGRVFSPAGLALGGEGPANIALSIIAQIQSHASAASGKPLAP